MFTSKIIFGDCTMQMEFELPKWFKVQFGSCHLVMFHRGALSMTVTMFYTALCSLMEED
jgi:hypothetical protein